MINSNLIEFQKKFNLNDSFMEIVDSLFNKLVEFGYIGNTQKNRLIDKLINNVNYVIIGTDDKYDYKTGFYDANKKTLYIKDPANIAAIYLRLLYAITTEEVNNNTYIVGFGMTKLAKTSYKLNYVNFALNRAVFSNIVCKLLGTLPANIAINIMPKSYSHNFLGYEITASNDIYSFEGKILSEMCYALDIDEELLYSALFSHNAQKSLERIFEKTKFENSKKLLKDFDKASRNYSTYSKLTYLSKLLNLNYVEMKKNVLDSSALENLNNERTKLNDRIESILLKLNDSDELNSNLENSLTETLEKLEDSIIKNVTSIQNILSEKIITSISYLSPYIYANKLQKFNNMLIFPNKKVSDSIFNTIIYKLMPDSELTAINLIQKLRYSLISSVLCDDKFTDVSKKIGFYANITDINPDFSIAHVFVTVNDRFSHIVEISSLDKKINKLTNNCKVVPCDNLKYLLNSDYSNMYVDKIEKVVSSLKESFPVYKQTTLDNMYFFNACNKDYLIVENGHKINIFLLQYNSSGYLCVPVNISDYFALFYANTKKENEASLLPVMYKKGLFKK